jgi:hypothetical protein
MKQQPEIQHGVPFRTKSKYGIKSNTLQKMNVGDSIVVPNKERQSWISAAQRAGKKLTIDSENASNIRIWMRE